MGGANSTRSGLCFANIISPVFSLTRQHAHNDDEVRQLLRLLDRAIFHDLAVNWALFAELYVAKMLWRENISAVQVLVLV
jgi:hypothetical protein